MDQQEKLTNGATAAAILASGIGSLALGLLTTLAEAIAPLEDAFNLYNPVGPLSGKTTFSVLIWLVAWGVVHLILKDKNVDFARVFVITMVLIGLGLLGTFPPFFEAFAR